MDEVMLAVETFYRIFEIYDVYEYEVTKYKPETGEGELFVPEGEERYVESFWQIEGTRLE